MFAWILILSALAEPPSDDDLLDLEEVLEAPAPKPEPKVAEEDDFRFDAIEEDKDMPDFSGMEESSGGAPLVGLPVDAMGKEPLKGNWEPRITHVATTSVLLEMPILVAHSRTGFEDPILIVVAAFVGEEQVAESVHAFVSSAVAELGPTFAWVRIQVPVVEDTGQIKLLVKKRPMSGGDAEKLFAKGVGYKLK